MTTPSVNGLQLPVVTVSNLEVEPDSLSAVLADLNMSVEAMIETSIYLKREIEKVTVFDEARKVLAGRIKQAMDNLPEDKRETRRTDVGMATYSEPGESVSLRDRDWTVEHMTDEQLRITYKPDLKAMETILKPEEFNRHVVRKPTPSKVSIRDTNGTDYTELDF